MISSFFIDGLPRLDIRRVARSGALSPGTDARLPVTDGLGDEVGAVKIAGDDSVATIFFFIGSEPHSLTVMLERTRCTLGGSRPWWRCPRCSRRAALLMFNELSQPGCCGCLRRPYASQYSGNLEVLALRLRRARCRLGPDGARPRHMRLATYRRLLTKMVAAEAELRAALAPLYEQMIVRRTTDRRDRDRQTTPVKCR